MLTSAGRLIIAIILFCLLFCEFTEVIEFLLEILDLRLLAHEYYFLNENIPVSFFMKLAPPFIEESVILLLN